MIHVDLFYRSGPNRVRSSSDRLGLNTFHHELVLWKGKSQVMLLLHDSLIESTWSVGKHPR
jgi:hypothetical protein